MDNKILCFDVDELKRIGAYNTANEIAIQPLLWRKVYESFIGQKDKLRSFIKENLQPGTEIILTGAGSSAFIGIALQGAFLRNFGLTSKAIATTDIISHPFNFIKPDGNYHVISFARSGDSPESLGALEIINQICPSTSHLIISCNEEGKLVKNFNEDSVYKLILPPESNDKGLAMTVSFTSMLLSGLLIANINSKINLKTEVDTLCKYGNLFLNDLMPVLRQIAGFDFERAVFLGSGPLFGIATESQLKLQELTNGRIICKHDSYLGLRHGPKAVINSKTLVVALLSNSQYALRYETDLIADIAKMIKSHFLIISESKPDTVYSVNHLYLNDDNLNTISEDFLSICFVMPAQIIGFLKAINLNISPDSPSLNGAISRVVEGVTIYPF